jgi:hypothetical protein
MVGGDDDVVDVVDHGRLEGKTGAIVPPRLVSGVGGR